MKTSKSSLSVSTRSPQRSKAASQAGSWTWYCVVALTCGASLGHMEAAKLKQSWRTAGLDLMWAHKETIGQDEASGAVEAPESKESSILWFSIMWQVWSPRIEARRQSMKVKQHGRPQHIGEVRTQVWSRTAAGKGQSWPDPMGPAGYGANDKQSERWSCPCPLEPRRSWVSSRHWVPSCLYWWVLVLLWFNCNCVSGLPFWSKNI